MRQERLRRSDLLVLRQAIADELGEADHEAHFDHVLSTEHNVQVELQHVRGSDEHGKLDPVGPSKRHVLLDDLSEHRNGVEHD